MTTFRRYEKIHRLGKEETDGILVGTVHVMEKIDGANLSVWKYEDGSIGVGSRNNDLIEKGNGFNGAVDYVLNHDGINKYLNDNPTHRLYGEWLVPHTIHYKETVYKNFYLFDIKKDEGYLDTPTVCSIAKQYGIHCAEYFGSFTDTTPDELQPFVGKSVLGDKGEGIVIKNHGFTNTFGDNCYAKIVRQDFMEDNAIVFGGNNKHSEHYEEMYCVNKYMTLARVQKIMNKIHSEVGERLDMKHIPRIIQTAYHDMLTEEIWEIQSKVQNINFAKLKNLSTRKAKQIYVDILSGFTSVADLTE